MYAGKNPDTGNPVVKVFLNPLVAWIWIGVLLVAAGTVVAIAPNRAAALALAPKLAAARALPKDLVAAGGGD